MDQELPPFVERSTVPDVPETQIVRESTGARPRNWRVLFVGVRDQDNGVVGLGCAEVYGSEHRKRASAVASRVVW